MPDTLLQAIGAGEAAGVIFFGDNIASDEQIAALVQQLRAGTGRRPVAAVAADDRPGGRPGQAPDRGTGASAKQIGQAADPAAAAGAAGAAAGQRLAGVGLNVNLAPVLDVYRQDGDFLDQYQRSYSRDPASAADAAAPSSPPSSKRAWPPPPSTSPGLGAATAAQDTDAAR